MSNRKQLSEKHGGGTVASFSTGRVNLVPQTIKLVDYYGDGEHARHFLFRFSDFGQPGDAAWNNMPPGKFFTLNVPGAGEAPFNFTYPPNQYGEFCALIRRVDTVTQALFETKIGSSLGARGPFGKPWPLAALRGERVLVAAGGGGLAPLVMLIDHLLTENWCESLALVYGARNQAAQMLTPERERWQKQIDVFDILEIPAEKNPPAQAYALSPHSESNIIPQYPNTAMRYNFSGTPLDAMPKVLERFGEPTRVLLCGPEAMMRILAQYFVARRLPPTAIWLSLERRMDCAVGLCGHCYLRHCYVCTDGPTFRWDEVGAWL